MYCVNCGQQLPDDANFCLKCGTPQRGQSPVGNLPWEKCELKYEHKSSIFSTKWKVTAHANGPNGHYIVGETDWFTEGDIEKNKLVSSLLAQGWEPVDNNEYRRRVRRQA